MDERIVISKVNEVYAKVYCNQSQAHELKEHLSCYITNHRFHPKVRAKIWDGRISFFNIQTQLLPFGLLPNFVQLCQKFNYPYEYNFDASSELTTNVSDDNLNRFYQLIFKDTKYYPRDYQHEIIKKAISYKRGVFESCTSSGKTLSIYTLIRFVLALNPESKVLLIVPNISLVQQMFSDFQDYGWMNCYENASTVYHKSKNVDFSRRVIISTWQSLVKRPVDFFEPFTAVIVDETQTASAMGVQSILKQLNNAEYRIGFTGTLPIEPDKRYNIFGYLGPLLHSVKSAELIDRGILSNIVIANILLQYPQEIVQNYWHDVQGLIVKADYVRETDLINEYEDRNTVFKYIISHLNKDDNVLILCGRITQLKSLTAYLTREFPNRQVFEVYGQTEAELREKTRQLMNDEGKKILVGTYGVLSTGINIKRLHHVIFAFGYKSKIRILQSIGRGLRTHESKSKLIVWDIIDDLRWIHTWQDREVVHHNFLYNHWMDRLGFYKNQGFKFKTQKIKLSDIDVNKQSI